MGRHVRAFSRHMIVQSLLQVQVGRFCGEERLRDKHQRVLMDVPFTSGEF